jgi:hypothetical protein
LYQRNRKTSSQIWHFIWISFLTEKYNIYGNTNCRCKDKKNPKKHGTYYQLSYTRYGKSTSEFVKRENVNKVKKQVGDYKLFMKLKDEWIDLSIEIAKTEREKAK